MDKLVQAEKTDNKWLNDLWEQIHKKIADRMEKRFSQSDSGTKHG